MFIEDYIMTFGIPQKYLEDEGYPREEARTRAKQYVARQFKQNLDELVTEDVLEEMIGIMRIRNTEPNLQDITEL